MIAGQSTHRESSVTAQTTDAPQIPPTTTTATEIQQPNRILSANPIIETDGDSTSASSVIGTTRQRTATRVSESDSSDESESYEDERGDHSASTEMAANSPLQFTPSSQGSAGEMSHIVLDPEDL